MRNSEPSRNEHCLLPMRESNDRHAFCHQLECYLSQTRTGTSLMGSLAKVAVNRARKGTSNTSAPTRACEKRRHQGSSISTSSRCPQFPTSKQQHHRSRKRHRTQATKRKSTLKPQQRTQKTHTTCRPHKCLCFSGPRRE